MKIYITRYPQLQLGGQNAFTKRYEQNNKAPKINKHPHTHTHTQNPTPDMSG